jgi:hypothetical protein
VLPPTAIPCAQSRKVEVPETREAARNDAGVRRRSGGRMRRRSARSVAPGVWPQA